MQFGHEIARSLVLAEETQSMFNSHLWVQLLAAIIFSVIGLAVLALAFWLIERFAPFPIRRELEEDQNTALAIVIGSVMIGISIIIAAAIHG